MESNKYHTRKGYEQLYINILREKGNDYQPNFKWMSDYHLLRCINIELKQSGCIEMNETELELELH